MYKIPFMVRPWKAIFPVFIGIVFILVGGSTQVHAQIPWFESFGNDLSGSCNSQGTAANGYFADNGVWTVTTIGANGNVPMTWYISAAEAGGTAGECNTSCLDLPFEPDQSLHISTEGEDLGAVYQLFPFPGFSQTNKRAESPLIFTGGSFGLEVTFDFLTITSATDFCVVEYFDGTVWSQIGTLTTPPPACGPDHPWSAGGPIALPASANNNIGGIKIGFRWQNADMGSANAISVAIDNIQITAGPPPVIPIADFDLDPADDDTFCEGIANQGTGCVTFIDNTTFDPDFSQGAATATYSWSFPGGTPATSSAQNPTVCYENPGVYNVTLTVEDNIGTSAPVIQNGFITVLDCGPVINISASQTVACSNEECIDFTDLSTTGNQILSWLWTFTSATGTSFTSTLQNPTNICLNEIGFYDVSLQATDEDGTESQNFPSYIEVIDCSGPEVFFLASRTVICPGACIEFTDMSTSPTTIFAWEWDLPGGQAVGEDEPGMSAQQNPVVCYDTPGNYTVTLTATDQEGPSAITYSIIIIVDPCTGPPQVGIGSSATEICTGDCVDFFDQSLGLVSEYLWVFQGVADVNDAVSMEQDPAVICYSEPGTYNVTLTASNENGQVDTETFVDYITVVQCINPPVPRIELSMDTVCAGECVVFTNVSTGLGIDSIAWNFQGALNPTSNEQSPEVCYNTPGTYSVSLYANGAGGDSVRVFNDVITVVNTPECRPTIAVNAPDTICAGTCSNFSAIFTKADSVHWTFPGGDPETSSAINPGLVCFDSLGNYTIIVEAFNAAGAATPSIFSVFVGERPPLNAGPNRTINSGAVVTLTGNLGGAPPIGDFLWQPYDMVDDFTAQSVQTSPDETTEYIVFYSEPGTCTASDSVIVFVNFVAAIGVPSAFSPNGDGQNDEVRVLGQGIARMNFKIWNRYGQMVFETKNQSIGWDGTHNGRELNPGTFVYTLEVSFAEGATEIYTGDITLVR